MNKTILIGRMTADAELKNTATGKTVVNFTLAVEREKKDSGADFINCEAWDKLAELVHQYCHRGDKVAVEGRITVRSYERDGKKQYQTNVVARDVEFLETKRQTQTAPKKEPEYVDIDPEQEDLPF